MAKQSTQNPQIWDLIVLGAGAAGLHAGAVAGQRGKSVLVIDHAKKPAEKVRISGGGRCNFTNLEVEPKRFLSNNPHFAKSALARYTAWDFIGLISQHGITYTEKTLGQLFADQRSQAIIDMLLTELEQAGGTLWLTTSIGGVEKTEDGFRIQTSREMVLARSLIVATGGLSIPKMGATGFAYDLARQFGHAIIDPRPALVPFTFSGQDKEDFASISGVATDIVASTESAFGKARFPEAMLFTHRGLSGPSLLQVSSYWAPGGAVEIDLLPGLSEDWLLAEKAAHPARLIEQSLEQHLPKRLVALLGARRMIKLGTNLQSLSDKVLRTLGQTLAHWRVKPTATEGWRTAEVTAGGIDTDGLSSKTMESKNVPGLYFIGECVDVTGWLGGYNFQWAWSSAYAAAQSV